MLTRIDPVGVVTTTAVSVQTILPTPLAGPTRTLWHDQMALDRGSQLRECLRHLRELNAQSVRTVETVQRGMVVHLVRTWMTYPTSTIYQIIHPPKKSSNRDHDIAPVIITCPSLRTLVPAAIPTMLIHASQHEIYPRPPHAAARNIRTLVFPKPLNHTRTAPPSFTRLMNALTLGTPA